MRTTTVIQVRFNDIDMAGHVHNAVYLSFFEQARMDLLRAFIAKDHDWKAEGLILARNEVDYRMPVRLHDTIEAEAWCSAVGTKSFDLSYRIHRIGGDAPGICAEGRSVMVCFDYTVQRSIAIPEDWRRHLEAKAWP